MDGHHLGVHGKGDVGVVAGAGAFEWDEGVGALWLNGLRLFRLVLLLLLLQLLLELFDRRAIESAAGDAAMLQSPPIEAGTVIVVALSNDLSTTNHNAPMTIVERRLGGLVEAESQILISLHFAVSFDHRIA